MSHTPSNVSIFNVAAATSSINTQCCQSSSRTTRRVPSNVLCKYCTRCKNHGLNNNIKNHKNSCEYKDCRCEKCLRTQDTADRRALMRRSAASGIEPRRIMSRRVTFDSRGDRGQMISHSSSSVGSTHATDVNSANTSRREYAHSSDTRECEEHRTRRETQTVASTEADYEFKLYQLKKKLLEGEIAEKKKEWKHNDLQRQRQREFDEIEREWKREEHELRMNTLRN